MADPDAAWIVMIHGATQHGGLFSAQEAHFGPSWNLLVIDLPGHGQSSGAAGPFGVVEYAAAVAETIDEAGVPSFHIWGTHTGSAVGLLLALRWPTRVRSLILEGAVLPGLAMPYVEAAIARARATALSRGVPEARKDWFRTADFFEVIRADPVAYRAEAQWQIIEAFAGAPWTDPATPAPPPDLRPKLAEIGLPTLLVNGEADLEEFLAVAETLEAGLPRATRRLVAGAGGFPLWEHPSQVNALVERWLAAQA